MEIYQILFSLLEIPDSPKYYRELRDYYKKANLENEADAIDYLIKEKFEKTNVLPADNPDNSAK